MPLLFCARTSRWDDGKGYGPPDKGWGKSWDKGKGSRGAWLFCAERLERLRSLCVSSSRARHATLSLRRWDKGYDDGKGWGPPDPWGPLQL